MNALSTWWKVALVEFAIGMGALVIVVVVMALRALIRRWS